MTAQGLPRSSSLVSTPAGSLHRSRVSSISSTVHGCQELVRKSPIQLVLPSEKACLPELSQLTVPLLSIRPSLLELNPCIWRAQGRLQVGSRGPSPGWAAGGLQFLWAAA